MGDSLMLLQLIDLIKQNDLAGPGGNGIELDWVNLDGGLAINMAKINASIEAAARYCDSTGGAAAIWFNSGLHDVDKYCSSIWT